MSDDAFIKYLILGDIDTGKYISEYKHPSLESRIKNDSLQIFHKICTSAERHFDERNKISAKDYNYFFTLIKPNFCFLIYVKENYPERLVFSLAEEIKSKNILTNMVNVLTKKLTNGGTSTLNDLIDKYQDRNNFDKIACIQDDVNSTKSTMKQNLSNMVKSVEDTEVLQTKAEALKVSTEDYRANSEELRKITFWMNFKWWIIGILVVLLVVGIIFWQFFNKKK